jgi:hypothetical protein
LQLETVSQIDLSAGVRVTYEQPSFAALSHRFEAVDDEYRTAEFSPLDPYAGVLPIPRFILFELVLLDLEGVVRAIRDQQAHHNRSPALYEELLPVVERFPQVQRKRPVVGWGSVYWNGGALVMPCADMDDLGRRRLTFFDRPAGQKFYVLFITRI